MALTFDEIFSSAPASIPADHVWTVGTTIVVTQQDGRTSYTAHVLDADLAARRVEWSYTPVRATDPVAQAMLVSFSDRGWDARRLDEIGVRISQGTSATKIRLEIMMKSWGFGLVSVELDLMSNAARDGKIYMGRGATIGHGAGKAVYLVTFGSAFVADRTPMIT